MSDLYDEFMGIHIDDKPLDMDETRDKQIVCDFNEHGKLAWVYGEPCDTDCPNPCPCPPPSRTWKDDKGDTARK
jgi:hypothetical protein